MTPQDTMRLALEALTSMTDMMECGDEHGISGAWYRQARAAIEALRVALAQQGEQQPVGYQWMGTHHFRVKLPKDAEKYAWRPVYAGSAPAAQPLSDEQIKHIYMCVTGWSISDSDPLLVDFAREIELHHGIGGKNEGL